MKRLLIAIPLFVILLNTAAFTQLLRLPMLYVHFQEHHQRNNEVGFVEFLVMHYMGDDGTTSDDDRDMELPFQHHEKQGHQIPVLLQAFQTIDKRLTPSLVSDQLVVSDPEIASPAIGALFRPPRP